MADSKFALSVIRLDGSPVYLKPGGHSERDLVDFIAQHIQGKLAQFQQLFLDTLIAQGVGFGRTQAHVAADAQTALNLTLHASITPAIYAAVRAAIEDLKSDIAPVH